jgi:ATP-dependent DNA helicase RecQ
MRAMADAGLVHTVTSGEYPLMTLTPLGDKVMRGGSAFQLVWPDPAAGRREVALKDHGHEPQLYSMLRDLRLKLAKREDVPPYVIFSNKTLDALARYQPVTTDEALEVPGIGAAKLQRYATPFLEAIRVWKQSRRA